MNRTMRPLTAKHEEMLADCYKRHINRELPLGVYFTQTARGLVVRGLLESREYTLNERKYFGFFITENGIDYLKKQICIR